MTVLDRRLLRGSVLIGSAVAVVSLAAACSSNGTPSAGPAAGSANTIAVRGGPLGNYLTDGSGRALYLFTSDGANVSSCSGVCLTYWPALSGKGKPVAANGVTAAQLASFARSGGASQVSYAGHPLYHFVADKAAGDIKGQGRDDFGARWWLVAPSGQPITGTPSAATSSAGAGSGGAASSAGATSSAGAGSGGTGYGGGGYGG